MNPEIFPFLETIKQLIEEWGRLLLLILVIIWLPIKILIILYKFKLIRLLRVAYLDEERKTWHAWRSLFFCLWVFLYKWTYVREDKLVKVTRALVEYYIIKGNRPPDRNGETRRSRRWWVQILIAVRDAIVKVTRALVKYCTSRDNPHPDQRETWKSQRWKILTAVLEATEDNALEKIEVSTAFDLYDRREHIAKYFEEMGDIGKSLKDAPNNRFYVPVVISGYVAPIYLLGGLLNRFNEDWRKMLAQFKVDNSQRDRDLLIWNHQLFTFYCWLQWGPSIPICQGEHCGEWTSQGSLWSDNPPALQVGYGDENNSFPLILGITKTDEEKNCLLALWGEFGKVANAPAIAKKITVYPTCSLGSHDVGPLSKLVPAQRHIKNSQVSSGIVLDYIKHEAIEEAQEQLPAYYSAYLWMMFVVCDHEGKPLHSMNSETPQLGLIPFFEHANIADIGSCQLSKRQLAAKVVAALGQILERGNTSVGARGYPGEPTPFGSGFIIYTCAFDDTGCEFEIGPAGSKKIREVTLAGMVESSIQNEPRYEKIIMCDDLSSLASSLSSEVLENLKQTRKEFKSCKLPKIIDRLYK